IGALVDRVERRRAMVACEIGQAVAVGAIVGLQPTAAPLLALVAVRSPFSSAFQAASRSVVVELVGDDDLESANALHGAGTTALEALGPLLAAVLLQFTSPRGLLGLDVVTVLVSPLLLVGLPRVVVAASEHGLVADARAGIAWMWRHASM